MRTGIESGMCALCKIALCNNALFIAQCDEHQRDVAGC